jgi:hypothetical protein
MSFGKLFLQFSSNSFSTIIEAQFEQSKDLSTVVTPIFGVAAVDYVYSSECTVVPLSTNCGVLNGKTIIVHRSSTPFLELDWYTFCEQEKVLNIGKCINLHPCFQCLEINSTKLFVRDSYSKLYEIIEPSFGKREEKRFIIRGTPGLGKTFFLLYILYNLKSLKMPFLFSSMGYHFILDASFPRMVTDDFAKQYLYCNSQCVYLYDAFRTTFPSVHRGVTVIATSPDRRNIETVKKLEKMIYYMPKWTLDEIITCYKLCYADLFSENKVREMFYYWGGSPRNVFSTSNIAKDLLAKVLSEYKTLETLISRLEDSMFDKNSDRDFQWLWHMSVSPEYDECTYGWPSQYIRYQVLSKLPDVSHNFLTRQKLLKVHNFIKLGCLYEDYVIEYLRQPTEGRPQLIARCRSSGEVLNVPYPSSFAIFMNNDIIRGTNNHVLYIPLEKNKESVDLVIPPIMLQITTAKSHKVSTTGIDAVKVQFPDVTNWKFCFIIPKIRK